MYDKSKGVEFTLKVMINKQKTKVLFAAVDSNFADVLLSFLTLPLGTIVRLLKKHYADDQESRVNIGSLTSLYNGLANLDNDHFETQAVKQILLHPRSSFEAECLELKLDISDVQSIDYFSCENWKCGFSREFKSYYRETVGCYYGKINKKEYLAASEGAAGVFTINTFSFLISDDLKMVPNEAVSIKQTLTNLGITDTDGAELINVTFGYNEIMDLLRGLLMSQTPLTDLIIDKRPTETARPKCEQGLLHEMAKKALSSNSKKITVKILVQKSTNKVLFAQAEEDFIDFLCNLLKIPLGGVEWLLDSKTCLKSIDNLYTSIACLIDNKYFVTPQIKSRLLKPILPHGCMSNQQDFFNLERECEDDEGWDPAVQYLKATGNYVKGPKLFMVSDELTVISSCMTSSLLILNQLKITLSDVKEVGVHVGLREALSILKASLTSNSALTDGLMANPMLKKYHKQDD